MPADAPRTTVSVVTISYNQAEFLERALNSVLNQKGVDIDYIVVDPGSTDGSRDIIERYRPRLSHVIFESDRGPSDGLNKGFAHATGDILCYLNSDDLFEDGAFAAAVREFEHRPETDVICGHGWIVDGDDRKIRKVWSDPYRPAAVAHGAAIQIQPSTFIRRSAFLKAGGFRASNRSNWDGELMLDLHLSGARIDVVDAFWSHYRLHETSITNSGSHDEKIRRWADHRFRRLAGRGRRPSDRWMTMYWKLWRQARNPAGFWERLRRGAIYRRGV